MASLDSLPPDQRAVLQLVLQRGRSYDDLAQMLSIDRAAVRQRALGAFDALGPQTRVSADRRALITDYLLGQLPARIAADTQNRLASSASERAWARVLASELAPLAVGPLPEIPAEGARSVAPAPERTPVERADAAPGFSAEPAAVARERTSRRGREPERTAETVGRDYGRPRDEPPRSRRGGAILLALGAVVVLAVIVIVIATSGSTKNKAVDTTATTPSTPTTPTTPTTASTPGTTTTTPSSATKVIAQFNLKSPSTPKTVGIVELLTEGTASGLAIVAQGVPANTKNNAYAVWLYNSSTDATLLGFVNPGVGTNGRLSTAGKLPTNASHYKQLIVTLETQPKPKVPGPIVLQGAVKLS